MRLLISIIIIFSAVQGSFADEGGLTVQDAWTRPTILENRPTAVYFTIKNNAGEADKLIKAVSAIARRIELHKHIHKDGVMKMVQVKGISVAAHGTMKIEPGGYHLMVFGLSMKFIPGDEFPLVLTFANAGRVNVVAKVMKNAPEMDHGKMKHDMMK